MNSYHRQQRNVLRSSCIVPDIFAPFYPNLDLFDTFFYRSFKCQISQKIREAGAALMHADGRTKYGGQTDGRDEGNGHFSQLCERAIRLK